jgi:integrase
MVCSVEIEGRAPKTLQKMMWLLNLASPLIGSRPIADLTAPELLEVLRKVEVRGKYETANRLRSTFGTIFRYAIVTGDPWGFARPRRYRRRPARSLIGDLPLMPPPDRQTRHACVAGRSRYDGRRARRSGSCGRAGRP